MDHRLATSRIMITEGWLVLVVAAIHLAVIPLLTRVLRYNLPAEAFAFVYPPFMLNHVVSGILLAPIGLSTLYAAKGLRRGEHWAWVIGTIQAVALLLLPVAMMLVMERRYFSSIPFLTAAVLITLVGLTMFVPLTLWRREFREGLGRLRG